MKYMRITTILTLVSLVVSMTFAGVAKAHEFTVLLASAMSGPGEQGAREGFLVAAAEQDAHPDETADGHLGGLDVFVARLDMTGDNIEQSLNTRLAKGDVDIVAIFPTGSRGEELRRVAELAGIVVIAPAPLPFNGSPDAAPVASEFVSAFTQRFGYEPDSNAAQGYQIARRIDDAVRPFDSAANTQELRHRLDATAGGFNW
ncbi:MAG: hypothetical protein JKY32_00860 [Rhizobiales bacterium]|nr:hypothetical protein [Hyphomicrobiales bacterium]